MSPNAIIARVQVQVRDSFVKSQVLKIKGPTNLLVRVIFSLCYQQKSVKITLSSHPGGTTACLFTALPHINKTSSHSYNQSHKKDPHAKSNSFIG